MLGLLEQAMEPRPENLADLAAYVFAKPCRARGLAMSPDTALPALIVQVVRTAHALGQAEGRNVASRVEQIEHRAAAQSKRRDGDAGVEPSFYGGSPARALRAVVEQNSPGEKIPQLRQER